MTPLPLDYDIIKKRLDGIQGELQELKQIGEGEFEAFRAGVGFKLAQYHLHRALEGVFNITAHILSRIPGAQTTTYKELAVKFGEVGIVDRAFAEGPLHRMAGYRNRLVHFYAEVTPEEVYDITQHHLGDFDIFMQAVKRVLEDPAKFGIATG